MYKHVIIICINTDILNHYIKWQSKYIYTNAAIQLIYLLKLSVTDMFKTILYDIKII